MENFDWVTGALFPYINFALFCFLAYRLFKKQIVAATAKKHEDYVKLIAQAATARKAAEDEQAKLDQRLSALDSEIQKMKDKAKLDAEKEAVQIVTDAQKMAEHLRSEAKRVIENEVNEARSILQQEIVNSVKAAVVGQVQKELTPEKQLDVARKKLGHLEQVGMGVRS